MKNRNIVKSKKRKNDIALSSEHEEKCWPSSNGHHKSKFCKFSHFITNENDHSREMIAIEEHGLLINERVSFIEFMSEILAYHFSMPEYQKIPDVMETIEFLSRYFTFNHPLIWPTNNISITMEKNANNDLIVYYLEDNNKFMLLYFSIDPNHEMASNVELKKLIVNANWTSKDFQELINLIEFIFKVSVDLSMWDILGISNLNPYLNRPRSWFDDTNTFAIDCQQFNSSYTFITQIILNHTDLTDKTYTSWITYPQDQYPDQDVYLKLELSTFKFKENPTETDYHSWVFSESEFIKLHSYHYTPESQRYFRFEVYEQFYTRPSIDNDDIQLTDSCQIMNIWFSLDSSFGELRDVKKGKLFTGTDVMSIFNLFNEHLLKIQTVYLCDASRDNGNATERQQNQIVFRTLMSVAYGKTWYEKNGYEAFQFEDLQQGYPGNRYNLSQDTENYYSSRAALMKLPLVELQKTLRLEDKNKNKYLVTKSVVLSDLCKNYLNCELSASNNKTLSDLTLAVYDKFKQSKDKSDLIKMYSLLVIPDKYLNKSSNRPTYYNHLSIVDNTRFFRKKIELQNDTVEVKKVSLRK